MALVLRNIASWLYEAHHYREPKLDHHPIVNYPFFGVIAVIVYLNVVKLILPAFMKDREPFHLKSLMLVYNAINILFNLFILAKALPFIINSQNDVFECFETGSQSHPVIVYYSYNKFWDLIETGLFVLRKKESQVSALHLIHHVQVVLLAHHGMFQDHFGPALLTISINATVHIVMYAHYFLSAYGIKSRWTESLKKSITKLQLCQFVIIIGTYLTVFLPNCKMVTYMGVLTIHLSLLMFIMFSAFYKKTYNKNGKRE